MSAPLQRLKDQDGRRHELRLAREGEAFVLERDGTRGVWRIVHEAAGELVLEAEAGGDRRRLRYHRDGAAVHVVLDGVSYRFEKDLAVDHGAGEGAADEAVLESPMTGRVVKVAKAAGDAVAEGEVVLVVEAMKMEHQMRSPFAGEVASLDCEEGRQVEMGQVLARLRRRAGTDEGE